MTSLALSACGDGSAPVVESSSGVEGSQEGPVSGSGSDQPRAVSSAEYRVCSGDREDYPMGDAVGCDGKLEMADVQAAIEDSEGGPIFDFCQLSNWSKYYGNTCTISSACMSNECSIAEKTCTKYTINRHLVTYTYYVCFN